MDFPLLDQPPDPSIPTVATDLEGTLTSGVTIRAIHTFLEENGMKSQSRAIYRKRMAGFFLRRALGMNLRGAKNEWMRDVIRAFKGVSGGTLQEMGEFVVETSIWRFRRKQVIAELVNHIDSGRRVVVVTGMSTPILRALKTRMPGLEAIGTQIKGPEDPFSGELGIFTVGRRKVEVLMPFREKDGFIFAAYGDTYSDIPMLAMSRQPTAVAPDRKLRRYTWKKKWRILEG